MVRFCKYSNEPLGSIKAGNVMTKLFKKNLHYELVFHTQIPSRGSLNNERTNLLFYTKVQVSNVPCKVFFGLLTININYIWNSNSQ